MKIYYKLFFVIFLGLNISSVFAVTIKAPLDQSVLTIQTIIDEKIPASELAGMQVTVNGNSITEWDGASASDTGWTLRFFGTDTFGGIWRFTNNGLAAVNTVLLDAFTVDAVFDNLSGSEGTEGSFDGNYSYKGPAEVEFLGPVKLANSAEPVGDLFGGLKFDFSNSGGLLANQSFDFVVDSDKSSPVPLPPAVIFFISGLLGLVGLNHRK